MEPKVRILKIAQKARESSRVLAGLSSQIKDEALREMAESLEKNTLFLKEENSRDLKDAREKGMPKAIIDRLTLTDSVIEGMAGGLREIAAFPDPVGSITGMQRRPNGLLVGKMRIPLGVVGLIYESRPNVTADAAGLCLKSGNAVILKGGSEAIHSNQAIGKLLREAVQKAGITPEVIQIIPVTSREVTYEMLKLEEYIDLIIPRGGEDLIRAVTANSRIPVIKHYKGVCHIYVDCPADGKMAEEIVLNAKVQRPGVCNAIETLLVHQEIAPAFLPSMIRRLCEEGVEIRGCPSTCRMATGVKRAFEEDWNAEYLDLILAVKVVENLDEAIAHIDRYGSDHTEAIITSDYQHSQEFLKRVNSSVVLVNASTRFNDGGQLGLGAEMGISTSKIHAFGPMGAAELTTTKFIVLGEGQLR